MKIFLLCIFLSLSLSMTLKMKQTLNLQSSLPDLKETALSRMLTSLIELHMEIGGPVEELMIAVDEFLKELETQQTREIESFERKRGEYLDIIQQFEAQISRAKLDIQTSESKIEIILQPRLQHIKESVDQMSQNIQENQEQLKEEEKQRNQNHQMSAKQSKDLKLALEIVQQSMELVFNMRNQPPSFLEVNKAKRSILQLRSALEFLQTRYSPLVATLVNLSQKEFDHPEVLEQIITLLKTLQDEVSSHLTNLSVQENKESEEWDARSTFLNSEYITFVTRKAEYEEELKQTQEKIVQETKLKEAREAELNKFTENLQQENDDWQKQTAIHDDLIIKIENQRNLTLLAKQNIQSHGDQLKKFADTKRKKITYDQSKKAWN